MKTAKLLFKIFLRLLALPFVAGILIIRYAIVYIGHLSLFMVYGGEMAVYSKKVNSKTILDTYNKLDEFINLE